MWDLPGPGIEPVSPALAGRFLTTVPPGKSQDLKKIFLFYIGVELINNVVLVSGVQHSDSVHHIHVSILFQMLFPFRLLQNIEQCSLCYAVGHCWLSILNIAVCTCQ